MAPERRDGGPRAHRIGAAATALPLHLLVVLALAAVPAVAPADVASGVRAYESGDFARALRIFEAEVAAGHAPEARYRLGTLYLEGKGVRQDYVAALRLIREAAEEQHPPAQFRLAEMLEAGLGVSAPEPHRAARWYRRAARLGHPGAQFVMAEEYRDGGLFPPDAQEAFQWYLAAARQGHAASIYEVGRFYELGLESILCERDGEPASCRLRLRRDYGSDESDRHAAAWYRRGAERGHAQSQLALGRLYAQGRGVAQDHSIAQEWFERAAEQGVGEAEYHIEQYYASLSDTEHTVLDRYQRAEYLRRADEGDVAAQARIADVFARGIGVNADPVTAYMWYNVAASRGDRDSRLARDELAARMTPRQIAEAQRLTGEKLRELIARGH